MRYRERLNIILIRDNGPRRSFRMRRSRFYLLALFFLAMPCVALLLGAQCWHLWQENTILRDNLEKFEMDYQLAEQKASRLEQLENLLDEENVSARGILLRQIARNGQPLPAELMVPEEMAEEGPGHEEYPVIDKGRVKIENVQVRAIRAHTLRVGLDLRNPENEALLSGVVDATLVTADGEKKPLTFYPSGAGNFRINRYKRAVMTAQTPFNANLVNSSIILEVREQNGDVLYQNIYAVQR